MTLDPNQMLSYRKHVQQDWSISISQLTFCFYNLLIKKSWQKNILFQLVDMNVIKDAQRDWVQCKHFVSEAMQGNVKGNQLLWDHILLFKPWNVKWENTNIQSTWSHWKVVWLHVEWLVWGVCRHKVVATNQLFTAAACAALSNRRVTFSIFFFGRESKHYGWSGFNRDTIICPTYIYHHKGNT